MQAGFHQQEPFFDSVRTVELQQPKRHMPCWRNISTAHGA
jgi:hypothetical protein